MSLGYPAAQGYTGSYSAPARPASSGGGGGDAQSGYGKVLQVVGAGFEIGGAIQAGKAHEAALRSSERGAKRAAKAAARRGGYEQYLMALNMSKTMGTQRAIFAGSGIEVRGAAKDILKETYANMSKDRAVAKENTDNEVLGYKLLARSYSKAKHHAHRATIYEGVGKGIGAVGGAM